MISKIYFYVILFLVSLSLNLGCSNSLTTRGESQSEQAIDESFPDIDDELTQADNEDLSDENFENFDESASVDPSVSLDEDLSAELDEDLDLDVEDTAIQKADQTIANLEGELEDFSDDELDSDLENELDGGSSKNSAGPLDIQDDNLDFADESKSNVLTQDTLADDLTEEDPFASFNETPDNLVTKDKVATDDPFADFLSDDVLNDQSVTNLDTADDLSADLDTDNLTDKLDDELDLEDDALDESTTGSLSDNSDDNLTDTLDIEDSVIDTQTSEVPFADQLDQSLDGAFGDVINAPINDDLLTTDIPGQNKITVLEYNSQNSNGVIVIKAEKPLVFSSQFDPVSKQFILNLQDVSVPSILQRPLYLKDFKQNFGAVKATPVTNGLVQVIVKVNNDREPNILTNGNDILISPGTEAIAGKVSKVSETTELNPMMSVETQISQNLNIPTNNVEADSALSASSLEEFLLESGAFYGDPINLQVSDEDITTVIGFIADYSGANIVIAPGVSGKITIKLRNVPWDQALLTIMKTRGLGYVRTGNVLRIAPLAELQSEATAAIEIRRSQILIEPTMLKVIPLEYASSTEILTQVTPFITKDRGSVTEDKRTSSIVINDTRAVITKVSKLIKELDLPPPQVLVEAKIVEATKNFIQTLGIRWGLGGQPYQLSPTGGQNNGAINITPTLNINRTQAADGLVGNQPLVGNINIGVLDFLGNIDAAIGISETDEQVRVISSPRVTTLNNTEATITQSSEILREVSTIIAGVAQIQVVAIPLQLQLKVTPQITSGSSVLMQLDVRNEFGGALVGGQSAKNSRQALAKVLVESNKTAVIGGIYDKTSTVINVGVPLLKDIPFFGWLFKTKSVNKRDTEIMIFITPRILDKNYSTPASSNVN